MYGLAQTSGPAVEPVTLAEQKTHMRVSHSSEDLYISALIKAAREWCEAATGRQLITATWKLTLPSFVYTRPDRPHILLPRPPLQSVSGVTYLDADGVRQTLSSSVYQAHIDTLPGYVRLKYNQSWPTIRPEEGCVEITYLAGYGAASASVPECARSAIMIVAAHLYEYREAVTFGQQAFPIPSHYKDLISTIAVSEAA